MAPSPVESAEQPKTTFSPLLLGAAALLVFAATNPAAHFLLSVLGLILIMNLAHLGGFVIAGLLARAPLEKIELFNGPKLAVLNFGRVALSLGSIPIGGSVSFKGMAFSGEETEPEGFGRLPLAWRWAIILSGPLAVFLLASACVGVVAAERSLANGFSQVVVGAFAPLTQGQTLLRKAAALFQTRGFVITLGVLSAKMTAGNLLPIPPLNGGQAIMELLRGRSVASNAASRYQTLGLTFCILMFAGWCVALCKFAFLALQRS